MKKVALGLSLLGLVLAVFVTQAPAAQEGAQYVCPPCDMACDAKVFDQPGRCPVCGAALVVKAAGGAAADTRPAAAILLFEGVQIIDYTGPYEVLGQGGYRVFTVAEAKTPLRTAMGMTVVPEYSFADAPPAEVFVVPGGNVDAATRSAATVAWVKRRHDESRQTMSVCNGAFILAKAGLLDGLSATTFYGMIDDLRAEAPKTRVVNDQRYVDNGRIITTAGLSSGIDGALHIIDKLRGHGTAQATALHMEYDWHPDSGWARAALADRLIPGVDLGEGSTLKVLRTEGDRKRWNIAVEVHSPLGAQGILEKVDAALAGAQWTRLKSGPGAGATGSRWKKSGPDGAEWNGLLTLEADPSRAERYTLAMSIDRKG